MTRRWTQLLVGGLAGCTAGSPLPELPPCGAALAVSTTDFQVGALAILDVEAGVLHDTLAPATGDPAVASGGCTTYQLQRGSTDAIRAWDAGDWAQPRFEVALPRGANAHDLAQAGAELVVAAYDLDHALVLDAADGSVAGTIDLSPYADADGLPEADTLVRWEDRWWISVQRLDRGEGWRSTGGALLRLDVAARAVDAVIDTGPNPRVFADGDDLVVMTGHWGAPDGQTLRLSSEGGTELLADEAEEQADHALWVRNDSGAVRVSVPLEADGGSRLSCDTPVGTGPSTAVDGWVVAGAARGDAVWLAVRARWDGGGIAPGLYSVNLDSCTLNEQSFASTLEPYDVTEY